MIIYNTFQEEFNTNLQDIELLLKKLNKEHPELTLSSPHTIDGLKNTLELVALKSKAEFAKRILHPELEEKFFFDTGTDVGIFQHLRYLPTTWHSHTFFEIAYVLQGTCTNYIMDQTISMEIGDICIIAPGTRHAISAFSDNCLLINIILRTSTFETAFFEVLNENDVLSDFFMHTLYHSPGHPYLLFRTKDDPDLLSFLAYAHHEFRRNHQYKNRMMISIINTFFILLLRNHGANVLLPNSTGAYNENTILILKYLQEHATTVTLSELSQFFGYSERQLQRIIKNSTGISFSDNIQKLRLSQATRLMQNPNIPLATISETLGYNDPGHFRQIFKRYFGMTPTEYRSSISKNVMK